MSEHTQGPWMPDKFALSFEIRSLKNPLIAVVQSRHCDSPEEMTANANLIAAAPELLEALKDVLECGSVNDQWWVEKARAAIAKAEGAQR